MPKLLVFAPCQKALIDKDNNASVIAIFQELQIQIAPERLPESAALPMKWDIFTLWLREESDEGKRFEQVCEKELKVNGEERIVAAFPIILTLTERGPKAAEP